MNQMQQPRERERIYRSHLGKGGSACYAGGIPSATRLRGAHLSEERWRIVEILADKSDRCVMLRENGV